MEDVSPQFAQLKAAMKSAWMAGDFGEIAKLNTKEGELFVSRMGIHRGQRVLDVACGTGNTAIPAARAGANVAGVDIAPNLLEQARRRAESERLDVEFIEGDAEAIPFGAGEFDVVISMFGAMFAPRPERVAAELLRVCKPGGAIAMANWTPEGFVGKNFRLTSQVVPPPPGIPAPVLWGDEQVVRQRLGSGVAKLDAVRRIMRFEYPFPPKNVVEFFRRYFGPTQMTFARLDPAGQAELAGKLETLWIEHNQSSAGATTVDAEYLEVRALRA